MQLKDVEQNKFIAVAVDEEVKEYGAMAKRKDSGIEQRRKDGGFPSR